MVTISVGSASSLPGNRGRDVELFRRDSGSGCLPARHHSCHRGADPLGCRLYVAVGKMSVAQCHPYIRVAEQARDNRPHTRQE